MELIRNLFWQDLILMSLNTEKLILEDFLRGCYMVCRYLTAGFMTTTAHG